ncbi:MAG TPA: glycosyltransferase [Puia sp.]|nr:glycosyltransferase [Puia sp.]
MVATIPVLKKRRSPKDGAVFSILIPSWNNLSYLKLCIGSIRKNSRLLHQVIVHINEGKDGTKDWVESQPDLDYTFSEQNIGVCYALNIGRDLVTTDYIVYLNDDMYVCPGWDLALLDEIKKIGNNYFFLSATAIEPVASSNCVIPADYGTEIENFREEDLLKEYATLPMRDWQGATWPPNVVHKDIWDLAGGYSVEFSPGMYSDPDFSMKLWVLGIRLFKGVSKSRAYHFGSKSTGRVVKNKGYYRFISKWGMTSSTLTKQYLRRGEPFDGMLAEPRLPAFLLLKNLFKRLSVAWRG